MPDFLEKLKQMLSSDPKGKMTVGQPEVLKYGALEAPTLDLTHRPYVTNYVDSDEGDYSTVRSMGNEIDGKEVLYPSVSEDGWIMNRPEAEAEYKRTGKHMGVYPDWQSSDRAGEKIHEEQAAGAPPIPTMHRIQLPKQDIEGTPGGDPNRAFKPIVKLDKQEIWGDPNRATDMLGDVPKDEKKPAE